MAAVFGIGKTRINETRLGVFLLLSMLVHWAILHALPSLHAASPTVTDLKKPIWVDLVTYSEPEAEEPASLSPETSRPTANANQVVAKRPTRETPPADAKKRGTERRTVIPEPTSIPEKSSREIPPAKDLIPSVQDILAKRQSLQSPFRSLQMGPPQEGIGYGPAETLYQQYLLELKRKVERNWKVSLDLGIREGVTVIYVIVADDGSLFSCDILHPSGMIAHDYEAMEAVKAAFPLSPPPKILLNEKGILPIRFSFHYLLSPPS